MKTLKDMEILDIEDYDVPSNAIEIRKLKQEVIELIKDISNEKESYYCLSQGCLVSEDMKKGAIRGLMHYLNITKEDLK